MKRELSPLQKLDAASLVALIVTMCSQLDVRRLGRDTWSEGLGYMSRTFSVALSDVVFVAVAAWFVMRCAQTKSWKRLWWPPLPCWALIFTLFLSLAHGVNLHEKVAEAAAAAHHIGAKTLLTKETKVAAVGIIQFCCYFLLAPWMMVNLLHDRREGDVISRRTLAIQTLLGALMLNAVLGAVQSFVFSSRPPEEFKIHVDSSLIHQASVPRGLLSSGNVFSALLAVALPLLWTWWAGYCSPKILDRALEVCLPIITLAAVFAMASVPSIVCLVLGIAVGLGLIWRYRPKAGLAACLAGITIAIGCFVALPVVQTGRSDFLHVNSDAQAVKKQYVEWQVAARWDDSRKPAFANGVGPGNYQNNIGELYYDSLPNEEKMPSDSNNLYLVQAVSLGVLGLGALLWVIGYFWAIAQKAFRENPSDWLPAGILASLVSWLLVNNFHALIVRGAGLMLAFLFALAVIAAEGERNPETCSLSEN